MEFPLAEVVWITLVFLLGTAVGSFINVVVGRLPLEKSILWPNSRCLTCLNPLSSNDNLPIIGWLRRRGRCRYCGAHFSSRYMWVELFTGIGFAALFYLDVMQNWYGIKMMENAAAQMHASGLPPWQAIPLFLHHATLFSFLLAAALCDWDHRSIPMSLTLVGTLIGLISATLFPWPFPDSPNLVAHLNKPIVGVFGVEQAPNWAFNIKPGAIPLGLYPWPVWGPVPDFLSNNRWLLGLLTGLTGAAAGMFMIRAVKFTFEKGLGREALGLGDADLMMMAGAFLGWQPVVVAFFIGAIVSLPVGIAFRLRRGDRAFPFGPGLAIGGMITMLTWRWIAPVMQMYLFEEILVLVAVAVMGGGLFIGSIFVRILGFGSTPATATPTVGAGS
jgi:leader peptidase (prepilin peptidase)/N-methyltransferase